MVTVHIIIKKLPQTSHAHKRTQRRYLVLIPWVLSAVSPGLKATVDGLSRGSANFIMLSHCSAVAKFGKYRALGLQLNTYS